MWMTKIRKLSPERRKKVEDRARELIAGAGEMIRELRKALKLGQEAGRDAG
jgi:hypothetical protein